jgi:hypothetical protein
MQRSSASLLSVLSRWSIAPKVRVHCAAWVLSAKRTQGLKTRSIRSPRSYRYSRENGSAPTTGAA